MSSYYKQVLHGLDAADANTSYRTRVCNNNDIAMIFAVGLFAGRSHKRPQQWRFVEIIRSVVLPYHCIQYAACNSSILHVVLPRGVGFFSFKSDWCNVHSGTLAKLWSPAASISMRVYKATDVSPVESCSRACSGELLRTPSHVTAARWQSPTHCYLKLHGYIKYLI